MIVCDLCRAINRSCNDMCCLILAPTCRVCLGSWSSAWYNNADDGWFPSVVLWLAMLVGGSACKQGGCLELTLVRLSSPPLLSHRQADQARQMHRAAPVCRERQGHRSGSKVPNVAVLMLTGLSVDAFAANLPDTSAELDAIVDGSRQGLVGFKTRLNAVAASPLGSQLGLLTGCPLAEDPAASAFDLAAGIALCL